MNKIIPFPSKLPFSPEGEKLWNKIDKAMQKELLNNVWCGNCRGSASIIVESTRVERGDLILRGKCTVCGNEVGRLVESE